MKCLNLSLSEGFLIGRSENQGEGGGGKQRSGIHFEQNESRRCLETCRFVPFSASNGNTGCLIVKCLNLSHSEGYLVGKFENQGGGAQRSQSTFSKMKITLKMNEINLSFTVFEVNSYK